MFLALSLVWYFFTYLSQPVLLVRKKRPILWDWKKTDDRKRNAASAIPTFSGLNSDSVVLIGPILKKTPIIIIFSLTVPWKIHLTTQYAHHCTKRSQEKERGKRICKNYVLLARQHLEINATTPTDADGEDCWRKLKFLSISLSLSFSVVIQLLDSAQESGTGFWAIPPYDGSDFKVK